MSDREFAICLLDWYRASKRELPWRDRNNAYMTWVSEIMLQQTRVEAVKPYFERFMTALPDVVALAACPEDVLLKLWEGLGYYSRVRNLQKAAQKVVEEYEGVLPASFEELLGLPGIGRYTAGAVSSIAYGRCAPAVDGNVLRVMTRIHADDRDISKEKTRREIEALVLSYMPSQAPGDFNQALMELGAVVCLPTGAPLCETCPMAGLCLARQEGTQLSYPVRPPKKERRVEQRTVFLIQGEEGTVLWQRPKKGLLAGLYEFPNQEGAFTPEEAAAMALRLGYPVVEVEALPEASHVFTHVEWRMQAYRIRVAHLLGRADARELILGWEPKQNRYAIPTAFRAYQAFTERRA